ncbi:hypothetical protein SDC9_52338 [bioreactor metagenome]|uniref:Uncharacterized protein n=1 Tax=bioreactor metagenome TaxID=1076179 RepID=A0A644WVD9_9ZZZZ
MLQCGCVLRCGGVGAIGERVTGNVQSRQCRKGFGDCVCDGFSHGALVGGIHLLLRYADRADALHRSAVGGERAREHMQEGRFASSVLADDRDARNRGEGEVHMIENRGGASHD